MKSKRNLTTLTNERLKSPKRLLTGCAALSALVNLVTFLALLISGVDFAYWIVPLVLTVIDGAFLAAVLVSNFRFSYAQGLPVYYIILTAAGAIWTFVSNGIVEDVVIYTTAASYTWLILHALCAVAVLLSALKAAKLGKKGKKFSFGALVSVALLIAATGFCGYQSVQNGIFGQGALTKVRAVQYVFDEDAGYYRVVGLVKGRGGAVVIPSEFNGEKVGAVDCSILDEKSVKSVRFESADVVLENPEYLVTDKTANRVIYIEKASCDFFRERFFEMAYEGNMETYLRVANAVEPVGLGEDEIYATFTYTLDGLKAVQGKTLDIWYGEKGQAINFTALGAEYAQKCDVNNPDHLYWSYDNLGKQIYKGVTKDGVTFDTASVQEDMKNLTVEFEPLYKVDVRADNDGLYELKDSFRYGEYGGERREKIVTESTADAWLKSVDERDGFTLAWKYGSAKTPFASLAEILSDGVKIYPEWTMNAPTVQNVAVDKPNAVYGDTVAFAAQVVAPNSDLQIRYEWKKDGETVSSSRDWNLTNVYPDDTGKYTLTATAYSDTLTTLTSQSSAETNISVGKKSLGFVWTLPENLVYSGTAKTFSANYQTADVINGDTVTFELSFNSARDVEKYQPTVSLTGDCADLYYVPTADERVDFEITPFGLNVVWSNTNLTYNGYAQKPTASATGVGEDGALNIVVSGEQKNAVETGKSYTATATLGDKNYTIINDTQAFVIGKATVNMVWANTQFTYNGYEQKPTASADGVGDDGVISGVIDGEQKDVGNHTATASLSAAHAKNYVISTQTQTQNFSIEKYQIAVSWKNISFIYNGYLQLPTASALGIGEDSQLEIVSAVALSDGSVGDGKNTGENHQATASTTNGNYEIENPTQAFTIDKATVNAVWTNTEFVYDGTAHIPTASVTGVGGDGALAVTVTGNRTNVGDSVATAELTSEWTGNYTISVQTSKKTFTIKKAAITLVWQTEKSFVYDGAEKTVYATEAQGVVSTDNYAEIFSSVTYEIATAAVTVGAYTCTAKIPDDSNYFIETGVTCVFEITKREISFVWSSERSFTYGDDLQGKIVVTGVVNAIGTDGEEIIKNVTYSALNINAGTHIRTATLGTDSVSKNYKLPTDGQGCEYTISQKEIALVWTDTSLTYNGKAQGATVFEAVGLVGNDKVTFAYDTGEVNANENGGKYMRTASLADNNSVNKNYVIQSGQETKEYTIAQKPISLGWNNVFTYNGKAQYATVASASGVVNGDEVTFTYGVTTSVNVGEYTQTVTLATDNPVNKNYRIIDGEETQKYTIGKKGISLNWNAAFTYNGQAQYATVASADGVIGGEQATFVYAVTNSVKVGTYTQTVELAENNSVNENYEILSGFKTREYTISQKKITLIWKDTSLTYNGGVQYATVASVDGLVGGDEVAFTYAVTDSKNADYYSQKATLVADGVSKNYAIDFSSETCGFNILKKEITLIWKDVSLVYNGQVQYATVASVDGAVNGDDLTFTYTVIDSVNVGEYTQTATTDNDNYKIVNRTQSFTIAAAEAE